MPGSATSILRRRTALTVALLVVASSFAGFAAGVSTPANDGADPPHALQQDAESDELAIETRLRTAEDDSTYQSVGEFSVLDDGRTDRFETTDELPPVDAIEGVTLRFEARPTGGERLLLSDDLTPRVVPDGFLQSEYAFEFETVSRPDDDGWRTYAVGPGDDDAFDAYLREQFADRDRGLWIVFRHPAGAAAWEVRDVEVVVDTTDDYAPEPEEGASTAGESAQRVEDMQRRVDVLERRLEARDERIDGLEDQLEARESRIDELEAELDARDDRIDQLETELAAAEANITVTVESANEDGTPTFRRGETAVVTLESDAARLEEATVSVGDARYDVGADGTVAVPLPAVGFYDLAVNYRGASETVELAVVSGEGFAAADSVAEQDRPDEAEERGPESWIEISLLGAFGVTAIAGALLASRRLLW